MTALSLIICTRDRATSLSRCLAAVARSDAVGAASEVVIVDNGSTDETPTVVERFMSSYRGSVQLLNAPVPGLSNARNQGMQASVGRLVAFTDDDCYVSKNFFSSCISAFSHGNFDYCGGRILPFDPEDAKYGYNENKTFSIIPPRTLIKAGSLQGANMIFRRSVIDKVGLFDANLGAGTAFRCEDIDYASRASLLGCVGAHVPDIVVFHHHRRKPGEDIERIKRLNDIARGAYYAKRVREGHFRYVQLWAEVARKRRSWPPLRRELKGALKYILNISA